MRISSILCVLCLISLTACAPGSEAETRRGAPDSTSFDSSATTESSSPSAESGSPTSASGPSANESSSSTEAAQAAGAVAANSATDKPAGDTARSELQLDRLVFVIPEGWQRKQASSSFVLAEFVLPKPEGAEADGRLTVSAAGGSLEANVARWRDQFGGKPEPAKEEKKDIHGISVTVVDFGGEFNDQRGPFAPPSKRPGYRMLGAIIPVNGELHFVKATGPQATIAAHADRFHQFIGSVRTK